jgi:hypothetical protein
MHAVRGSEGFAADARLAVPPRRAVERWNIGTEFPASADGPPAWAGEVTGAPLACLAGGALARHFHAWHGVSGRRYVFSVFSADGPDLPDFEGALLIAASVDATGRRRIIDIGETGRLPQLALSGAFVARAREAGARELHFHLSAKTAEARQAVIRDLLPGALGSSQVGCEPGERAVLEPERDEVLVRGSYVVGIVP